MISGMKKPMSSRESVACVFFGGVGSFLQKVPLLQENQVFRETSDL